VDAASHTQSANRMRNFAVLGLLFASPLSFAAHSQTRFLSLFSLTCLSAVPAARALLEDCSGKSPPPADAPCGAAHDIVVLFDTSEKDNQVGGDGALDNLLHSIIGAYELEGSSSGPRIALVAFELHAYLVQGFTSTKNTLSSAINSRPGSCVGASNCGTDVLAGLLFAQNLLEQNEVAGRRKVIIAVIDGQAVRATWRHPWLSRQPSPPLLTTTPSSPSRLPPLPHARARAAFCGSPPASSRWCVDDPVSPMRVIIHLTSCRSVRVRAPCVPCVPCVPRLCACRLRSIDHVCSPHLRRAPRMTSR
jgi:hypothetical protein